MPVPVKYSLLPRQSAPDCPFDLEQLDTREIDYYGKYLVARLQLPDDSKESLDKVISNLRKGEEERSNARIVTVSNKGPRNGVLVSITWGCQYGSETKLPNVQKAAEGPDLGFKDVHASASASQAAAGAADGHAAAPAELADQDAAAAAAQAGDGPAGAPGAAADVSTAAASLQSADCAEAANVPKQGSCATRVGKRKGSKSEDRGKQRQGKVIKGKPQMRREPIRHGESDKRGCCYRVFLKQYEDDRTSLFVQIDRLEHVDAGGNNVHKARARFLSTSCRDRVYDLITQEIDTDTILRSAHSTTHVSCMCRFSLHL